mgnify:CR=1 FL=1
MSFNSSPNAFADLSAALVQIARRRGSGIERSRADQLLAEAQQAWPGDTERMWALWLAEGEKGGDWRVVVVHKQE